MQGEPLRIRAIFKKMTLQHVSDPAIEALEHAVCLWSHRWRETMFDAYIGAELIELISSRAPAPTFLFRADVLGKEDMVDALIVS